MKQILVLFLTLLIIGCKSYNKTDDQATVPVDAGDSITTIDSVSYYWVQVAEDTAVIRSVKEGEIFKECLVIGPSKGAIPTSDKRFSDRSFLIVCGDEDQYLLFDTKNMPSEFNLLTKDNMNNSSLMSSATDLISNLKKNNDDMDTTSLFSNLGKYARRVGRVTARPAVILYYTLCNPATPKTDKYIIYAALAYVVLPIDLISAKRVPILGWADEAAAIAIAYKKVKKNITPEIEAQADAVLDKWFKN